MKNSSIAEQLDMQERQISDERKVNEYSHVAIYADKQKNISENVFENRQDNNLSNNNESKQNSNTTDLGLSSVLGLLTPNTNKEEEQIPMERKKKKPKWGFRR